MSSKRALDAESDEEEHPNKKAKNGTSEMLNLEPQFGLPIFESANQFPSNRPPLSCRTNCPN